ncbi:MAG: hypothetical protein EA398_07955 [Deltaproteobacteria bacterium]|nr:MAG: hypothetical protein EA398_07955 [Deltaproteobacteria bacterium]
MSDIISGPQQDQDDALDADKKAKRAARSASRRDDGGGGLNINSMMDMMTIILVFLLKSYSTEPIQINQSEDLRLPWSTTELAPEDTMTITLTKTSVLVNDELVVAVNDDGRIDPSHLQSADSPLIPNLQQKIEDELEVAARNRLRGSGDVQRVVTIIADSDVRYELLTQVMITASAAQVQNFKFAGIQREQGSGLLQAAAP